MGAGGQVIGGFTFGTHIGSEHYRRKDDPTVFSFPAIAARGKTLLGEGFPTELARAAIAEHNSLQSYVTGDFWPLLPLTVSPHDWCAFQLHRHDLKAGFALFFQRHESAFPSMRASLRWIDPTASYKVTFSASYDPSPEQTMAGRQLQELTVLIDRAACCCVTGKRAVDPSAARIQAEINQAEINRDKPG